MRAEDGRDGGTKSTLDLTPDKLLEISGSVSSGMCHCGGTRGRGYGQYAWPSSVLGWRPEWWEHDHRVLVPWAWR